MLESVVNQIFSKALLFPNKKALIEENKAISYSELASKILATKFALENDLNIKKGDRVIISANKQIGFVYAYFGAHLAGVIVVPVDFDTNQTRLQYIILKIKPALMIGFENPISNIMNIPIDYFDNLKGSSEINKEFPQIDEIADIVFTTGTTGDPKGVILKHRNIAASANNINIFIQNTSEDVELLALPVSHSFGLGRIRCVLSKGATLILLGSFTNVKKIFRIIETHGVTGFAMVPSSWAYIKKMSGTKIGKFSHLIKYIEIGSAPMPMEDKHLLIKLFPLTRICMHYGLTEASRSSFIEFNSQKDKLETVGKSTPNVLITIKDENGTDLPIGVEGEICVKGDSVTSGYWNDTKTTTDSFWSDSFRTGDWGVFDESGYLSLKSRKKEIINVGGKKVSPIEVEVVLVTYPGIKECACIGIEDPNQLLGEVIKAFIVLDDGINLNFNDVKKYVGEHLEAYKIPVVFETIPEIPKTSSGKIQRLILK
ncbi:MAG: acyl--CoA ligase [Bacteroidetes bacterium]|nr:acyl--CoA ligase [Bacteroidota bacterium]